MTPARTRAAATAAPERRRMPTHGASRPCRTWRSSRSTRRRDDRRVATTTSSSATPARTRSRAAPIRHVPRQALDDAPVRRLRHARGHQRSASSSCSSQGQTGLSTAFDMPTLMGYDADHPRALGEVGREGVAVSSRSTTWTRSSTASRSTRCTTSMTINCAGERRCSRCTSRSPRSRACRSTKLGGTIQNDMLKEFIAQKEWICPPAAVACASSST